MATALQLIGVQMPIDVVQMLPFISVILMLVIFVLVNAALVLLKSHEGPGGRRSGFRVPMTVPLAGALSAAAMLFSDVLR